MILLNVYHTAQLELIETLMLSVKIMNASIVIQQYEIVFIVQILRNVNFFLT